MKSGEYANASVIDLSKVEDRKGNGNITFQKIETLVNGVQGNKLSIGDDLTLRITIKGHKQQRFKMALHLYKYDETRLSNIENGDSQFHFDPFTGEQTLEVEFKKLMLYPGQYKIGLWMGDIVSEEQIDFLRMCAQFEVLSSSSIVYRGIPRNSGVFYFQPNWKRLNE